MFNENFLKEVLILQEQIKNLITPDNVTLKDICFAPFNNSFSGPITNSMCTIQSIWGYWKDDLSEFEATDIDANNYTVNYLDHFKMCSQ